MKNDQQMTAKIYKIEALSKQIEKAGDELKEAFRKSAKQIERLIMEKGLKDD